jgi:hypothetical protein
MFWDRKVKISRYGKRTHPTSVFCKASHHTFCSMNTMRKYLVDELSVIETKYWENQLKGIFWLTFSGVQSMVSWTYCLWIYGKSLHYDSEYVVGENSHLIVVRKHRKKRGSWDPNNNLFKGTSLMTSSYHPFLTPKDSAICPKHYRLQMIWEDI